MATPRYKIHDAAGVYVAACRHAEDAACLVGFRGDGATIRVPGVGILWREGKEEHPAAESYDDVATIIIHRERLKLVKKWLKAGEPDARNWMSKYRGYSPDTIDLLIAQARETR